MVDKMISPYGSWSSPITAGLVASSNISLDFTAVDGDDTYWVEMRPAEGGRYVIVRRSAGGDVQDVNPPPFNARTRVHEYGGGMYAVAGGTVYFANFADQRLYRQQPGGKPKAITPEAEMRYADLQVDSLRNRLICVREDHTGAGEAVNTLVDIDLTYENAGRILVTGHDFYASPRLSPDGARLAWLAWNHPNMPWDGTELWLAEVAGDGSLLNPRRVAGDSAESIFQPEWSPDGVLTFVSDRNGWWNLYRLIDDQVEAVWPIEAELGMAQWVFGLSMYAYISAERIACIVVDHGVGRLAELNLKDGRLIAFDLPYTHLGQLRSADGRLVFYGASPTHHRAIVQLSLSNGRTEVFHHASDITIDEGYLSIPEPVEFPTENGLTAHGFYYPPRNKDYRAPAGELPPLIVISHGGPTSMTWSSLALGVQFWTSRGIGVLDVNYGGSTGYGRAYRERLNGQWGVVDVVDCTNGARYLVDAGRVDSQRLAIRGRSAGGYTTLCALTFHDVFKAGASYYGVSDLVALAEETHKFESRYLDSMVGPYPEQADIYRQRSPINHVDRLSCPLILFQGLEDKIVLPNQAELMLASVREKGLPVAYLPFDGEQHGFRRSETIIRALEAELYFYGRVFGFEIADEIEPVAIDNLH